MGDLQSMSHDEPVLDETDRPETKLEDEDEEVPYTILTPNEKKIMTALLSMTGICSSLSMPIYWVALNELEAAFNIDQEKVNMTVVAYLCFQAVAPVFVSTAADFVGRRPMVLICVTGGVAVNIGLAVSNAYWLIIFLRCLLAVFVSPLVSITSSIVGDFTTRKDRGGINGMVSGFTLIGQGFAPFLGAAVDTGWDWRAIFYFSAIVDGVVLLVTFIALPETNRSFVGNLSARPEKFWHQSLALSYFGKSRLCDIERKTVEPRKVEKYNPIATFAILFNVEVAMTLIPSAIMFATWTISQTSMTTYLSQSYGYSTIKVGLCFFAPGCATMLGAIASGKAMDYFYRKAKTDYDRKYGKIAAADAPPFSIVRARVGPFAFPAGLVLCATLVFGWCLQYKENVAIILVTSFCITFGSMYPLNLGSTLLVDLYPQRSGSAASINNLTRCGTAAIMVACLSKMTKSMTLGGTYSMMAGLILMGIVMIYSLLAIEKTN